MNKLLINTALGFEEIELGNKVIDDFVIKFSQDKFGGMKSLLSSTELFYHSSFEWCFIVLDLIERLGYETIVSRQKGELFSCKIRKEDEKNFSINMQSEYKITAIWTALIKFCRECKIEVKLKTV